MSCMDVCHTATVHGRRDKARKLYGCILAVFGLYGAVCVYGLLYGTGAQGVGVDSPSSIESTPRAHGDVK